VAEMHQFMVHGLAHRSPAATGPASLTQPRDAATI